MGTLGFVSAAVRGHDQDPAQEDPEEAGLALVEASALVCSKTGLREGLQSRGKIMATADVDSRQLPGTTVLDPAQVHSFKVHRVPQCDAVAVTVESSHTDGDISYVGIPKLVMSVSRNINLVNKQDGPDDPASEGSDATTTKPEPLLALEFFSTQHGLAGWEEKFSWFPDGQFRAEGKGARHLKSVRPAVGKGPRFFDFGNSGSSCCKRRRTT